MYVRSGVSSDMLGMSRHARVTSSLSELGWLKVDELMRERDLHIMHNLPHNTSAPDLIRCHVARRADVSSRSTRAASDGQLQTPCLQPQHESSE